MLMNYAMGLVVIVVAIGVICTVVWELTKRMGKSHEARSLENEALQHDGSKVAVFRWELNVDRSENETLDIESKDSEPRSRGAAAGNE